MFDLGDVQILLGDIDAKLCQQLLDLQHQLYHASVDIDMPIENYQAIVNVIKTFTTNVYQQFKEQKRVLRLDLNQILSKGTLQKVRSQENEYGDKNHLHPQIKQDSQVSGYEQQAQGSQKESQALSSKSQLEVCGLKNKPLSIRPVAQLDNHKAQNNLQAINSQLNLEAQQPIKQRQQPQLEDKRHDNDIFQDQGQIEHLNEAITFGVQNQAILNSSFLEQQQNNFKQNLKRKQQSWNQIFLEKDRLIDNLFKKNQRLEKQKHWSQQKDVKKKSMIKIRELEKYDQRFKGLNQLLLLVVNGKDINLFSIVKSVRNYIIQIGKNIRVADIASNQQIQ